jgi:hypothetical protein
MLERRVARTTTVSASLASSHITQLWTGTDVNLATPVKAATYPVYNASGSVVSSYNMIMWTAKNNSNYAHVYSVDHSGWSWYNAGVLELRHQMQRGLDVQASYTWSHGTGTSTGPMVDGIFPLTSVPGDFEADKGNLPTDQRHRAVLSWTWESRLLRGNSWVARYLVNGWHISGIATLASGLHATRTALLTGNQFSTFTMAYFSSLNGSGGWARIPFEQVGSLSTDAQRNLDARIARTIPFTERIKGSIGFEVLDVFNYQPSTGVNTIAYTAIATLTSPNIGNSPYTGALRPVGGVGAGNASVSYPDGTSARRAQLALKILF